MTAAVFDMNRLRDDLVPIVMRDCGPDCDLSCIDRLNEICQVVARHLMELGGRPLWNCGCDSPDPMHVCDEDCICYDHGGPA